MASQTILAAEFYPAKGFGWLDLNEITPNGGRHSLEHIRVANKREARKVAAERGAKPWNF